jgi:hypothetical protein
MHGEDWDGKENLEGWQGMFIHSFLIIEILGG